MFLKNGVYRFAILDFYTFWLFLKILVRTCKPISMPYICTPGHIKIKSVRLFEELAVVTHLYR